MKLFKTLAIAAFCAAPLHALALTVESTPGSLRQAVGDNLGETSLTVSGSMDVTDFDFLREMKSLRSLDLSEVTIAPYSGARTATGQTSSPAGVLPYCALMSGGFSEIRLPKELSGIADGALGDCRDASEIVIPASVTSIATGAFSGMKSLKSVVIPASVKTVGNMLFKDCTALEKVVVEAPLAAIPASTFQGCTALTSVTLPASVGSIGSNAFAGCKALATFDFPASLTTIGSDAFAGTALEAAPLASCEKLVTLGDWAFAGCASLKSVSLPASLRNIGKGVFFKDAAIDASIAQLLPGQTAGIPDYLLYGTSVDPVDITDLPVDTIGAYALSGMSATQVKLPSTLTRLGDNAMERWNLEQLDVTDLQDIPELGNSVWAEVDQPSVVLLTPHGMADTYRDLPQWQDFDIKELSVTETPSIDDGLADPANLRATFDGTILHLSADIDIRAAQLYDVSGRCFTIAANYQSTTMQVDTAPYDARVFIVRVLLADGTAPVLKLAR